MRTDEFFEALGELDDSLIINARNTPDNPVKIKLGRRSWKPFAAAAACIAALVAAAALNVGKIADFVKSAKTNDGYPKDAIYRYNGDFTELELVEDARAMAVSYSLAYYRGFDYIAEQSDLIISGTFVDDARQTEPVEGEMKGEMFNMLADYTGYGKSYNKLRVDRVFKGGINVGDEIIIGDEYVVNNGGLYHRPFALTPMIKGDSWVYFLTRDDDGYYDALRCSRYPLPGEEHPFVLAPDNHGVYDSYFFNDKIYEDVKIMLGCINGVQKLGDKDWAENYEFYMPDFLGEKFVWRNRDVYVMKGGSETARILYAAPGISSIYLADLNGDGKREMISECWNGASGLSTSYIFVYDHANSKLYGFGNGIPKNEFLTSDCLEIRDNVLYAVRKNLGSIGELYAAPVKFEDLEEVGRLESEIIEYNGKTYLITDKTIYDGEVFMSIGLTQLEYQVGDIVEVLAMVHNYTGKPIRLQMPVRGENSHTEVRVTLKQGETELYEYFGDGGIRGFDDAISYHTIEPGDTYYQEMQFGTYKERYDPVNTIIPLYKPLGAYEGSASIAWTSDPDASYDEMTHDQVGFSVNIADRVGVYEGKFRMYEFPDVEFSHSSYVISAEENGKNKTLFSCASIDSLYLSDINGDGKREICASVEYKSDSGITDERILVYDYANKKLYELSDNGNYDYYITIYNFEGVWKLRAVKCDYMTGFELYDEPLTLEIMKEVQKPSEGSNPETGGVTKAGGRMFFGEGRVSKFRMPEYLGDQFICGELSTYVQHEDGSTTVMFTGTVDKLFLADLNGDGKREFIAVFYGFNSDGAIISGSIVVFDYANGKFYGKVNDTGFTLFDEDNRLVIYYKFNDPGEPFTLDMLTEITE